MVFPAGPQPRSSTQSVPCRTSTTTIQPQCSLPDLNHDHPRPVCPAGPQPRLSTPSVSCRTIDRKPEDMPDRMSEGMPDRMSDRMPAGMPDKVPEGMTDKVSECLPDRMPEDLPDRMPDRMPKDMPEDMPGRVPEDMPDRVPDRMPEDMSDRMPEDLPVTKRINVMVGINRSKVISFFHFSIIHSFSHSASQPASLSVVLVHSLLLACASFTFIKKNFLIQLLALLVIDSFCPLSTSSC